MKRIQVSKRDVKLLIILLSLIILYIIYQFVYLKNLNQAELLSEEIKVLESRLADLKIKVNDGDKIMTENEAMRKEFEEIVKSYGNGASEEKSIMMVHDIESIADMSIDSIVFHRPEYFFNGTNIVTITPEVSSLDQAAAELARATGDIEEMPVIETAVEAVQLLALDKMSGYKASIGITFRVSYDGLKKCIDYINNYREKCNVGDISMSFDTETGNLNGTMTIHMYHLTGEGIEYQKPVVGGFGIGTDNIFGTIELPVNEDSQELSVR